VDRADAMRVARNLMELLDSPILIEGHAVQVGASVGIAIFPDDAGDAEAMCIAADVRMYACKRAARIREDRIAPATRLPYPFQPADSGADLQVAKQQ
jgi:predicted signal transduction protein with EAL and GGDEF domain